MAKHTGQGRTVRDYGTRDLVIPSHHIDSTSSHLCTMTMSEGLAQAAVRYPTVAPGRVIAPRARVVHGRKSRRAVPIDVSGELGRSVPTFRFRQLMRPHPRARNVMAASLLTTRPRRALTHQRGHKRCN